MIRTIRTIRRPLALALLLWCLSPPAAATASGEEARFPRIRTDDRRLQRLLDDGTMRSATLRALVERIAQSDLVVYVVCDGDARRGIAGRLTFLSAAGGVRYLVVRLAPLPSRAQQIAILAHELQHAVEVADAPAIVDSASLAREYLRIGRVTRHSPAGGIAFDTQAAIDIGQRVLVELETPTAH